MCDYLKQRSETFQHDPERATPSARPQTGARIPPRSIRRRGPPQPPAGARNGPAPVERRDVLEKVIDFSKVRGLAAGLCTI